MFYALLDPLRRSIGLRLGLWCALIFTICSVALFAFSYYLLAGAIGKKDLEVLKALLSEAAAVYEAGGARGLGDWCNSQGTGVQKALFVRLSNPFNIVTFAQAPEDWVTFNDTPDWPTYRKAGVVRIPQNAGRDYMVAYAVNSPMAPPADRPNHHQPRCRPEPGSACVVGSRHGYHPA
jgi:hypothetical protein